MTQMPPSEVASAVSSAAATSAALPQGIVDTVIPVGDAPPAHEVSDASDEDNDTASSFSDSSASGVSVISLAEAGLSGVETPDDSGDESDTSSVAVVTAVMAPPVGLILPTGIHLTGPWVAGEIYGVVPTGPLQLVPDNGEKWYTITKGKYVGCTPSTAIADGAVTCVSHALRASYGSQSAAVDAFNAALLMPWAELVKVIRVN